MFENPFRDESFFENPLKKKFVPYTLTFLVIVILFLFYLAFLSAPKAFPAGLIYDLKSGETLSSVSADLSSNKIIRSQFWFKAFVYTFSLGKSKIISGDYFFNNKENLITVAWRISQGQLENVPIKVLIPEGLNNREIADIFSSKIPSFNKNKFISSAIKLEGYLFPDTYYVTADMTEDQIIKMMNDNFNEKIKILEKEIKAFGLPVKGQSGQGKTLTDVIKMASILELEARTPESRSIVAGILWKRISIKMALQVDSSIKYINGKTSKEISTTDLQINSPYNTYVYRGFPPTPISNPGLASIEAAITPTKTNYLYFLTDNQGNMHYAATYAEHLLNKEKYLSY